MMLSILAQGLPVYAEEVFASEAVVQAEPASTAESADSEQTEPDLQDAPQEDAAPQEPEVQEPETQEPAILLLEEEEIQPAPATPENAAPANPAGVEVTLVAGLPVQRTLTLNATLTAVEDAARSYENTLTLVPAAGSTPAQSTIRFGSLPAGQYVLRVWGSGFAAYTQTLTVGNLLYAVQLSTGALAIDPQSDSHPGVLRIGDVDNSGTIEDTDADVLVDAIQAGESGTVCDLNGDGAIDLIDLQMLADSLSNPGEVLSTVFTKIPDTLTFPVVEENTTVSSGSLEELVAGTAAVTLQPAAAEAISEANPVSVSFDIAQPEETPVEMGGIVLQTPADQGSAVTGGTVIITDTDGREHEFPLQNGAARAATVQNDGSIVIDFGGQIAVKKVTIKITAVNNGGTLAEISKVEFVNDMESRIPAPEMNIPQNLVAEPGSQSFTLTWDAQVNVTGYEVLVTLGEQFETVRTTDAVLTVTTFGGKKLENNTRYTVQVQSLNGEWRSGYSDAVTVTPKADKLPPAPDGLTLTGRFQRLEASWDSMKDTDTYNLYYRKAGDEEFTRITDIASNSYTLQGLENNTRYEVYITGVNELGEGPASLPSAATTANVNPVQMPAYKLINTPQGSGVLTAHIASITHMAGYMKDSPLDSGSTALGIADGDYTSWYGLDDWDDGAAYPDNGGVRVTFDGTYHIGTISLAQIEDRGSYGRVRVFARNEAGKEYEVAGTSIVKRSDGSRSYYTIKIPGGVTTDYLRVCVGYTYQDRPISIAEIRFYEYDSLEDDILALYADDLHVTLREDVDEGTIDALQERLDTPDEVSGERNPEYDALQRELDNARGLLQNTFNDVVQIHTTITSKLDGHVGFTGLNSWQPLGVTAKANEEIVVYVGSNNVATGSTAWIQLLATQYNAEYGQVVSKPIELKVGRNEITIPDLVSFDAEHGGALYIQFVGGSTSDQYSVRVSGGETIPVLDLYGIDDAAQRQERVTAYVEALETYTAALEERHNELHGEDGHAYDPALCVLNTTDVQLDQMLWSVPASQLLAGLGSGSAADKAARLLNAVDAMDQMMELFYQHKGLTNLAGAGAANRLPSQHLNIRYMRMFAGAFMYAAGNHIGIGWDSVPGLADGTPITLNEDGSYRSGNYFGWGIAHEIGHNINQSVYAVAEVTNNYFSQISQANEGVRFHYDDVYAKVTSGTSGPSGNVFTQLAMYWQLHLAYDKGYEYQLYTDYSDLLNSRFFARVDTYARSTGTAPAPGGVSLSLGGDANQNFMRLAAAAAQKDLTEFFGRWGLTPDATTAAYMAQFEAETRAVYYTNDNARTYSFTHDAAASFGGQNVVSDATTAVVDDKIANQVNLTLASHADSDLLLGYEIARITYENGKAVTQVVGFTTGDSYTDTITGVNNRAVAYQITAIDNFLNRSAAYTLPALKISHDGSYDKSLWTVTTNMTSEQDTTPGATEQDPCEPEPVSAITQVIDNDKSTTYTGTAQGEATVTLNFHKTLAVTGFKYTVTAGTPIQQYELQYSADGSQWNTLATGTFTQDAVNTIYFPDANGNPWLTTYDASQLRLIVKAPAGSAVSISELDVLGPTGDNVELLDNGIGTLAQDFTYAEGQTIPEGSLVFTGSYKGNPAYNVVLLYDQNGNIVGGVDAEGNVVANQIVLAPDPEDALLGDVSEGYWVYWIEPDALEGMTLPETVRAELYRVDDAATNEGQRLTSDTLAVTMPETLPPIKLSSQSH